MKQQPRTALTMQVPFLQYSGVHDKRLVCSGSIIVRTQRWHVGNHSFHCSLHHCGAPTLPISWRSFISLWEMAWENRQCMELLIFPSLGQCPSIPTILFLLAQKRMQFISQGPLKKTISTKRSKESMMERTWFSSYIVFFIIRGVWYGRWSTYVRKDVSMQEGLATKIRKESQSVKKRRVWHVSCPEF